MRQVTHALLTRPPLSHKNNQSEEIKLKCFVRLACVKHAASVHPEPGSNSHVHILSLSEVFHELSEKTYLVHLARFPTSLVAMVKKFVNPRSYQRLANNPCFYCSWFVDDSIIYRFSEIL